jgi:hypothetical protein
MSKDKFKRCDDCSYEYACKKSCVVKRVEKEDLPRFRRDLEEFAREERMGEQQEINFEGI